MDAFDAAEFALSELMPQKSRNIYMSQYERFMKWCSDKNVSKYTESVFLSYFYEESKRVTCSTLWSYYSMLKSTMAINKDVDISKFHKLTAFLKRKNDGYRPKKAKIFTREELELFFTSAPDNKFLLMKVIAILGIAGACRRDELVKMKLDDMQDIGSAIIVNVPDTKTGVDRVFTISGNDNYLETIRKYINLRPNCDHNRLLINYNSEKCTKQPVGVNKIGKIPSQIATFLNLLDPRGYTGHSFRRTSATLLVDSGGDITSLKRHGGWKSTKVAEGYIENSIQSKLEIANKILGGGKAVDSHPEIVPCTSASSASGSDVRGTGINISNCNNCIITLNM